MATSTPRGNTRTSVLKAASERFRSSGYEGTTMAAIARDLGISPQALYWHFPSKDDLLHAFLKESLEETLAAFDEVVGDSGNATEQLQGLVRAHVKIELESEDGGAGYGRSYSVAVLSVKLPADVEKELRRLNRRALEAYRAVLKTGIASGEFRNVDVRTTAFAISSMCTAVPTWFKPGPSTAKQVADAYAELSVAMVRSS